MKEFAKAFATIYRALPRWTRWTIPLVVLAVVVAATSSSSGKTSPSKVGKSPTTSQTASNPNTTKTPSTASEQAATGAHRRYIAEANAACGKLNRLYGASEKKQAARLDELLRSGEPEGAREQETRAVEVLTVTATGRADGLAALSPPPGEDRTLLAKMITNSKERASDIKQVAEVIAQGQPVKDIEQALVVVRSVGEEFERLVERAHVAKCAGEP